jgi:diaminohydroxyphosphoribosylaminopyrimidine deaminase/5-amino-6-(5-phosphoribosylamino)uracil reductase
MSEKELNYPFGSYSFYMDICFQLALKGKGKVSPNPMVGAIIVYNKIIIGQGYHEVYGGAHAEINAFSSVRANNKKFLKYSAMFVSLEPCCHFGKTGPCTSAIIKSKIPKIFCSSLDPNPLVAGKGIKLLNEHGIETQLGILKKEGKALNVRFFEQYQL